jgi:hypothetical protein
VHSTFRIPQFVKSSWTECTTTTTYKDKTTRVYFYRLSSIQHIPFSFCTLLACCWMPRSERRVCGVWWRVSGGGGSGSGRGRGGIKSDERSTSSKKRTPAHHTRDMDFPLFITFLCYTSLDFHSPLFPAPISFFVFLVASCGSVCFAWIQRVFFLFSGRLGWHCCTPGWWGGWNEDRERDLRTHTDGPAET